MKVDVCTLNEDRKCEAARLKLKSKACQGVRYAKECKKARKKLDSLSCMVSLVYEGMVDSGQNVELSICKSPADEGKISMRAGDKTSIWIRQQLINDGAAVSYP